LTQFVLGWLNMLTDSPRGLSDYQWRRQVILHACVTPVLFGEEHRSLVQRYFLHVFTFRHFVVRSDFIHLFVIIVLW
jgi:hypothetical protein